MAGPKEELWSQHLAPVILGARVSWVQTVFAILNRVELLHVSGNSPAKMGESANEKGAARLGRVGSGVGGSRVRTQRRGQGAEKHILGQVKPQRNKGSIIGERARAQLSRHGCLEL